jgi:hypothetical protein
MKRSADQQAVLQVRSRGHRPQRSVLTPFIEDKKQELEIVSMFCLLSNAFGSLAHIARAHTQAEVTFEFA